MGLIISRSVGEAFWIGDDRYHVRAITSGSGCTLANRHGEEIQITASAPTLLAGGVSILEGLRRSKGVTPLIIKAPQELKLLRGELKESALLVDDSQSEVALLVPVPRVHLVSALDTCKREHKVAFGSRAWETLNTLKLELDGRTCPALIYGSDDSVPFPPKVTWKATYIGFTEAKNGAHPDGSKYRPKSSANDTTDSYIFWEVRDLQPINADDGANLTIAELFGFRSKKKFAPGFRPERPMLIENPYPLK